VHLPQIDVIHPEPGQRGVQDPQQVPARAVPPAFPGRAQPRLRGDQQLVPGHGAAEQAADDRLGLAVAVHVGGVQQVAARGHVRLELGGSVVRGGVPAPGHGAQREPGHQESGPAERSLLHGT
jgi:hypothetical protein